MRPYTVPATLIARNYLLTLISLLVIVPLVLGAMPVRASHAFQEIQPTPVPEANSAAQTVRIFLPSVASGPIINKVLLGISPSGYVGDQSVVNSQLLAFDQWAGKRVSIVGFFMDIEEPLPSYNIHHQFDKLRLNGYTGFLNLMTNHKMYEVAIGRYDNTIRNIAKAYAAWSNAGPDRVGFIAPFPEMNGDWYTYGEDAASFKTAFQRIRNIFNQEGVKSEAVRWVFAPNGWSNIPLENFYPGDSLVDVFSFSSYNYGYCDAIAPWQRWVLPDEVFGPYIQRFQALNPNKPIFIAQTASTARYHGGYNDAMKNQWLHDTYNYLASQRGVKAILYFNIRMECDWPIFVENGKRYDGYKNGVANPAFIYMDPAQIANDPLKP